MAGNIATSALLVGFKQWYVEGGELPAHMLAALDIGGNGLAVGPISAA
jgi:hypothetical protein